MPAQLQTSKLQVQVGGNPLADDVHQKLVTAYVEDNLNLPDLFSLSFRDPDRSVLAKAGIEIGSTITVAVVSDAAPAPEKLITGEVTALEVEAGSGGTFTVVRGFDHAHRLFRGRTTAAYKDVTYGDVARKVATRAGLQVGRIDTTPAVHSHVSQSNLNDWQVLSNLAQEIGFEVAVVEGKLEFRKPATSTSAPASGDLASDDPLQLTLGKNVLRLRAIVTSAEQVKEVHVRGWDVAHKQALVGTAPAKTVSSSLSIGPADLAAKFGSPTYVDAGTPFRKQAEVDAAAKAVAEQIASGFAEVEGVARGNPKLKAGTAVSLGLAGKPFDGRYTLTTTRHVYDPEEGYTTWFTASGRQERSLLGLTSGGSSGNGRAPVQGVVSALVTDVRDPENLGRVKLKFPWLSDTYESDWARTVQSGAGHQRGFVNLPEVNDEVLVAFEQGDMRQPYVIGGLYNGVDTPQGGDHLVDDSTGAVNRRGFISKAGHGLVFFDGDGKEGVAVLTGDKALRISLNKTRTTVKITSSGEVVIEAKGAVTVKATGDLELSGRGVNVKAQSGVNIDGGAGGVDIKGTGKVGLKGMTVDIAADTNAEVKGGAMVSVRSALVKIN